MNAADSAYPNFKGFMDTESAKTTEQGKEIYLRAFERYFKKCS